MKKDKKDYISREEQEKSEGYKSTDIDVPNERYQTKQQDVPSDAGLKTKTDKSSFSKEKVVSKGAVTKQEVAARVVDTGIGGEILGSGSNAKTLSYGGNEGTILASAAYTPSASQARGTSRIGKKLDPINKKINFLASEQVEETFDESKPLAESKDSVQGYNGTPKNINARSQKNAGAVPGDPLFQRSIDEIKRQQLYYSTGQVVKQENGPQTCDTPTRGVHYNAKGVAEYYDLPSNLRLDRSNYLHRTMRIKFDSTGKLVKMTFDVVDCTATATTDIVNASSANATIDRNYAEADRQKIDHNAGDERTTDWSPLARAIEQPTQVVGMLRDFENITGSEIFLAYKKTAACHSYQLNKAAKDGMKLVTPMAEMLLGLTGNENDSTEYANYTTGNIFNTTAYKNGAASLYIAIYDSVAKYNNKGDVLTQPRSLKLALQAADNNMNPFRIKSDLVKVINSREVFSTIDREYDPLQPVCISDRSALIHCYDFNKVYSFDSNEPVEPQNVPTIYRYMYWDMRNQYIVPAALPLLIGMHKYLNSIGPKIVSLNDKALANQEIAIPMVHSTCFFSLWSLLVLSAVPFIGLERITSMRDVLYYEKNFEYPFHQLITIKDANPMNALNYGNDDYQSPLVVKRMSPSAAITWVFPEVFWPLTENEGSGDVLSYVLPWYFNQSDYIFNENGTISRKDDRTFTMSMPSVRSGVRFGYLDDIYSMTERDIRLSLDRLTDIPKQTTGSLHCGVYKYSQNVDGIPFVSFSDNNFTLKKFLSLPRELGWFVVAPAGTLAKYQTSNSDWGYSTANGPIEGQSSYIAKFWHGLRPDGATPTVLDVTSVNVDRSTAYKQYWDAIPATHRYVTANSGNWGFKMSLADILTPAGAVRDGDSRFIPFTTGNPDHDTVYQEEPVDNDNFKVVSFQKAIWTRLQKLPFALSPWDFRLSPRSASDDGVKVDPFDFLYYFGLSGFKASDYSEDVYNRLNEVMNKGFLFLQDPFCNDSPLFKEASVYTQSVNESGLIK